MFHQKSIINAGVAVLCGSILTILALIFLLVYFGLPLAKTPEEFVFVSFSLVVLGGVIVGIPLFILFQQTVLGW